MIGAARKDAAIPDQPPSGGDRSHEPAKQPERRGARRLGLVGFLVELVLPAALAGALLFVAASHLPLWDLRTTAGLVVFGVLLVAASVFLSIKVDGLTLARRRKAGASQLLNRAGPWPRLVKFILAGVVVPVAALVAANRVELPGHRTPMALAIAASAPAPELPWESKLAAAVLRASDPAAKVEGILALQAAATPAAFDELLRIADADPAALAGGPVSLALAKALASFGAQAAPKLLQRLAEIGPTARKAAACLSATCRPGSRRRSTRSERGTSTRRRRPRRSRGSRRARTQPSRRCGQPSPAAWPPGRAPACRRSSCRRSSR
jgi:hypothetical protein